MDVEKVKQNETYALELYLAYEKPIRIIDLRFFGSVHTQYWRQYIAHEGVHHSGVYGAGLGAGLRLPLLWRVFADVSIQGTLGVCNLYQQGWTIWPGVNGTHGFGLIF